MFSTVATWVSRPWPLASFSHNYRFGDPGAATANAQIRCMSSATRCDAALRRASKLLKSVVGRRELTAFNRLNRACARQYITCWMAFQVWLQTVIRTVSMGWRFASVQRVPACFMRRCVITLWRNWDCCVVITRVVNHHFALFQRANGLFRGVHLGMVEMLASRAAQV